MTGDGHHDPDDMLGVVESSPDHWAEALAVALDADVALPSDARAVLVVGMGGSGIAGDVAALLADVDGSTPVVAVKGYALPAWAGPDTPVVAVSHSGGTGETLAALDAALDRGCPVVAVTSGGPVAARGDEAGFPVVRIPGGMQPRAAIAHLVVPVLVALDRGGHCPGLVDDLAGVADHLRAVRRAWGDEPVRVAESLVDRVAVFVGGTGVGALVALRARCQVNENAERPALALALPEADHNAIVGWGGGPAVPFGVVELRDPDDDPRTVHRFGATQDLVEPHAPLVHRFHLDGPSPVARLAAGVLWVDLVSVHLALATGVDPTPVDRITSLKRRLADA